MGRAKRIKQFKHHRFITVDSVARASKDIFALILDTDAILRAHGISSIQYMSDVLSAPTQKEKLEITIETLKSLKDRVEETDPQEP